MKKQDIIFPVLHGLYGEDGTIQGLLELLKVPYVGCKVLASGICMDKVYAKMIFEKANINQAKAVLDLSVNLSEGKDPIDGTEWKLEEKAVRVPYVGVDKDNVAQFKK